MGISERDGRVDGIKWLLIVLVTIGHAIEPALSNPTANKLYSLIYLFHMPLFIYISGYFVSVSNAKKNSSQGSFGAGNISGIDDSALSLL